MIRREPIYFDAVHALVGGELTGGNDFTSYQYHDGQTPPKKEDVDKKFKEMQDQWKAEEYARNRAIDYPEWGDQLNKIYDDGIDKWKTEMVDPVKAKWPKDNSGPK